MNSATIAAVAIKVFRQSTDVVTQQEMPQWINALHTDEEYRPPYWCRRRPKNSPRGFYPDAFYWEFPSPVKKLQILPRKLGVAKIQAPFNI